MRSWHDRTGVLSVEVGPEDEGWRTAQGACVPDALAPYLRGVCEVQVHFRASGSWEPPRRPAGVQRESSPVVEDERIVTLVRVEGETHAADIVCPHVLQAVVETWEDEIYDVEIRR